MAEQAFSDAFARVMGDEVRYENTSKRKNAFLPLRQ